MIYSNLKIQKKGFANIGYLFIHFYKRRKQKFVYIHLFVLARRFYCFLKNFQNVGYDILERGYRYVSLQVKTIDLCDFKLHNSYKLLCNLNYTTNNCKINLK